MMCSSTRYLVRLRLLAVIDIRCCHRLMLECLAYDVYVPKTVYLGYFENKKRAEDNNAYNGDEKHFNVIKLQSTASRGGPLSLHINLDEIT